MIEVRQHSERTLTLQISSPENRYLTQATIAELEQAVQQINASNAHSVLIEGTPEYFSAGGTHEVLQQSEALITQVIKVPQLLLSIEIPTIAVMQGHAIGGGLLMGLWCDFAILAEESLYGANFMTLGFTPGMGGTAVLEEAFGAFMAREMMFTGKLFKGRQLMTASQLGLQVHPKAAVQPAAEQLSQDFSEKLRLSLVTLKTNLARRRFAQLQPILQEEQAMHTKLFKQTEVKQHIDQMHAS